MAGQIATKTFHQGMNKDLDFSLLKDGQYYDANNYKLISDDNANGFTLETAEGNAVWIDTDGVSGLTDSYYIVGHIYIHPYLVVWYTTNSADMTPSGGTSKILRITLDKDKVLETDIIYDDSAVTGTLDLCTTHPINAVAHYESDDIIKVYWTDGYNDMRWMNIMSSSLASYSTDLLDLVPNFPYNVTSSDSLRPIFTEYTSGAIDCSAVQYAFQYYIPNGPTTVYSPASSVIPIPRSDSISSDKISGGDENEDSGYGVTIQIITGASSFTNLRIAAIQYNSYNGTPTVRVLKELNIYGPTSQTLYINDVGETLTEITYDDYLVQSNTTFTARDLAIKDNYLFAGNIIETTFDVDVDCRAYRHSAAGVAKIWDAGLSSSIEIDDDNTPTYSAYADISETHDCVNLYNKSVYDSTDDENSNTYIYQDDGSTIGASGPNIDVGISVVASDIIDTLRTTSLGEWSTSTNNYGARTCQRNEVYRVAAVFRNAKMQPSPAKWVCDFKIPSVYEDTTDYSITNETGGNIYSRKIFPYLNYHGTDVSWANTGATTMELVIVPRTSKDRSIIAQGIVQQTYYDSSTTTYWPVHDMETEGFAYSSGTITSEVGLIRFLSPEISFNKNLTHHSEDFLHYLGHFEWAAANSDTAGDTGINKHKVYSHISSDSSFAAAKKKLIDNAAIIGYVVDEDYRTAVDGKDYQPYVADVTGATGESGPCTTHGVISTNTDIDANWWSGNLLKIPLANYKRDVFTSQYGGLDYYSRLNNTYISISRPDDNTAGGVAPVGYDGDTFIDWFFYYNAVNDLDKASTATEMSTFLFPVETSLWTSYRLDDGVIRNIGSLNALLTQEISGTHESDCVDGTTRSFVQDVALYQYNTIYSKQNESAFYYPISPDDSITEEFSTRIKYSDHKINREDVDSFTVFRPNNFIDLDGKHGELNNLEVFSGRLFYWQTSGFGVASVNTRSLIEDNEPGILALGTGGVLDRFDYISDKVGNTNQFGITKSRTALYWADNNKNEFFKYDGEINSISKLGGIQTWINSNGQIGDIKAVYDSKYNDIIFTITFSRILDATSVDGEYASAFTLNDETDLSNGTYDVKVNARYTSGVILPERNVLTFDDGGGVDETLSENPYGTTDSYYYITIDNDPTFTYTISFSEMVNAFVSFHSFTPAKYIELSDTFLSSDAYGDLYIHNPSGENQVRGEYYGTTYDSEFITIFNKDFPYTKVWDALRWYSDTSVKGTNASMILYDNTFEQVSIYNDYQHTGNRYLYYKGGTPPGTRPTEFVRRDRTFSMQIPRNIVDALESVDISDSDNWDESATFKDRIRDKYIAVHTIYDNSWDGADPLYPPVFSIPFISAIYRRSIR